MTGLGAVCEVPDPSWTPSELIARAEGCVSLSAGWLVPLTAVDPLALNADERVTLSIVLARLVAVTEAAALRALG